MMHMGMQMWNRYLIFDYDLVHNLLALPFGIQMATIILFVILSLTKVRYSLS